ncbi:MAG: recombinase family protein [Sphingobium sp.]
MGKARSSFDVTGDGATGRPAVIYCRVSDAKQVRDGDGLNSQETRCREFARRKGYVVVEVYKDDISGRSADRPAMTAMLDYLRKRRTSGLVVIIDDISRLARGLAAHLELRASISRAGGVLESPSIEFGEDADSILVENLLASVSQHQRQKNGEQTKNRMRARVMNGYWVFQAPTGYTYVRVPGRGQMLQRQEPTASIVREALEGYASGRFETQADVMRFLQDNPLFPKDSSGTVRHQRVNVLLTQCVYAGYIEAPNWDVSRRLGQHEALISYETFERIQNRLERIGRAPHRKNLNEDFSLRGFVECADCGTPLTSCWSKGSHARYPYYLCPKRGCDSYGKSIRRELIEGQFEELLHNVRPTPSVFAIARRMFRDLWDHRLGQAESQAKALKSELENIESQVAQFLDRVVNASVPSVIAAYEERIRKLEESKLLVIERLDNTARPASRFDDALRTALDFLANPWNLWQSDRLEDRRTVLKLTFTERLRYKCKEGFRTANLSLPFNLIAQFLGDEREMARPERFERPTLRFVV